MFTRTRLPENGDRNKTKKKRRWFTSQRKNETNTEKGPDSSTSTEPRKVEESFQHEKRHDNKEENNVAKYISQHNVHVDPVVSTSILLSHFDDDSNAESELTADHDGASRKETDIGSSAKELLSADNQRAEKVEESDDKGDVVKLVDNCSKHFETYTNKLGPTYTESTSSKAVDVSNRDLSGCTYFKTSMTGILSKYEEASTVEPVSEDIGRSDVETTPDRSVDVAKPIDIKGSSDKIVKRENEVDISIPDKPDDAEGVSKEASVPNRQEQSMYCFEKSTVETTKVDVHESLTETEIKNGREACPEEICYSNEITTEEAKEVKIGKKVRADDVTKANADEKKTLEATDVNRVSKAAARSRYAKPKIIVVKPVQPNKEIDNIRLDNKDERYAALTCENKLKLAKNEINKTAFENKVDESKQSLTKCKPTVSKNISHSADATEDLYCGKIKRETTKEIVAARLVYRNSKSFNRSLHNKTPCYNDVKATSDGKARKEIVDKPVHNAEILADATTKENNRAKDQQLKAASNCPTIPKKSETSNSMKELAKLLEALSVLKVPVRSDIQKSTRSSIEFSRHVISPHQDTSIRSGKVNTKHPVLPTYAVSSTIVASQNVPSSGSSVYTSRNTVMTRGMTTRAVSPQQGPCGSSHVSDKPQESSEAFRKITSTEAGTVTSSDVYVKPQTSTGLAGNLSWPQFENPHISGSYKSSRGIQTWLKNSMSEPLPSVTVLKSTSRGKYLNRKVSDFEIPEKKPRPPQKPMVLKKPSPHLYGLPGIAKSDLAEETDVKWTQRDLKGPQTEVLWSSKPTSYDVKFPPLPKRLLEREGSIDKLRNSWVIPQVKQIETLKREFGRFPGLRVPEIRRNRYSVDINNPNTNTVNDETIGQEKAEYKNNLD